MSSTVGVVGLGKIGLPLAVQYASKGCTVHGIDVNEELVDRINRGDNPLPDEARLPKYLPRVVESGNLEATTSFDVISDCDVVVIIVPVVTTEDYEPDYSIIDAATQSAAEQLAENTLVVFETTLPVGATRDRMTSLIEDVSGLAVGKDFFVAYSPERVYSGRILEDLETYPKVIGGIDDTSTERATAFYKTVLDAELMPVKNLETAEAVKLFGMAYRNTNFALANEFAKFADAANIDVTEAIAAANTIPHFHIHNPSRGVGGHCAPVYPHFLIKNAEEHGEELQLAKTATEINDAMPAYTIGLLDGILDGVEGKRILILGLSYRGNVKEAFKSPAVDMIRLLNRHGAEVCVHDPLFTKDEIIAYEATPVEDIYTSCDAVILNALHTPYEELDLARFAEKGTEVFLDGLNAYSGDDVRNSGLTYKGIGVA